MDANTWYQLLLMFANYKIYLIDLFDIYCMISTPKTNNYGLHRTC